MKLITIIVLSIIAPLACYSKNKKEPVPSADIELRPEQTLIEHDKLCYTFFSIGDTMELMDDCINTLLRETKEDLDYFNYDHYLFIGHSNIEELERKAIRRSKQNAVWIAHQLINNKLKSDITIVGKGTKDPLFIESKDERQNRLNNRVDITIE